MNEARQKFDEAINFFKQEISKLRTGRATPSLVEHVPVDAYGVRTPLLQLASITTSDARTLVVQPWDKGLVRDIEKALQAAELHTSPIVEGALIRLPLPALNEENRKALVKLLHQHGEACKVSIRQSREKIREHVTKQSEDGEVSEDIKFKQHKQLDELVKDYNTQISEIIEAKETEIMTL